MDKRAVLGGVAVLAAVDVALWFAVFERSTPPVTSSSGSQAGDTSRVATASPEPSASTASAAPPSERPSEQPSAESPSAESSSPEQEPRVEVTSRSVFAAAFETVPIRGVLHGVRDATTLRVQHRQDGRWTSFPLPTTTDAQGRFTAYVEMGAPGRYPLRVLDPRTGVTSPVVVLIIR